MNKLWEPQDDQLLRKYASEFMSSTAIADRLSNETGRIRTKNAVIGRANRKGVELLLTPRDGSAKRNKRPKPPVNKKDVVIQENRAIKTAVAMKKQKTLIAVDLDESKFVQIHQLTMHTCRYPVKNITDRSFIYCGKTTTSSSSYCAGHAGVCFQPRIKK